MQEIVELKLQSAEKCPVRFSSGCAAPALYQVKALRIWQTGKDLFVYSDNLEKVFDRDPGINFVLQEYAVFSRCWVPLSHSTAVRKFVFG